MDVTEAVNEAELLTPRSTLAEIARQCEHALAQRLTRRLELRQSLKALEKRCEKLLSEEDSHAWAEEFTKVVTTADSVFGDLIAQVEVSGHA